MDVGGWIEVEVSDGGWKVGRMEGGGSEVGVLDVEGGKVISMPNPNVLRVGPRQLLRANLSMTEG